MPGVFLDPTEPPQFLTEKIGRGSAEEIMGTLLALVEAMGFEAVFGRIFRWRVDKSARKIIEEMAKKALAERGQSSRRYTHTHAVTLGAGQVIMCHEAYIMDGAADDDVMNLELDHEREHMVGVGRIHEDNLATLMTPFNCVVTTTDEMMKAMYGVKNKRVMTGDNYHELVIFYDDEFQDDSTDSVDSVDSTDSDKKDNDPFARWANEED
jgi:hypothetical protein